MPTETEIKIAPLPMGAASGAAVSFPKDADRNARFKARFPKARWSSQTGSWLITGKTAAQRAALWAEEEAARGALEAKMRLRAEIDRAWHEADPAVRAAKEERRRRREAEEAAAEEKRQAELDSRRYKPDDAMIERIVEAHKGRIGSAYTVDPDILRAFLRRGIAPGSSTGAGPDSEHFGAGLTVTYLGDGRMLVVSKYPPIRGKNGRWQDIEVSRRETSAEADLMEMMLSNLARREFRPRSGFGLPNASRR
ncbi:MAG: hypothetical protein J0I98_14110 [Mesorhizobium sp.]|nr:hypothetical protein [Mesorhizobium sp.]MBN9243921.1 hypothetical protein [Mesorhizobium sp.]